MKTALHPRILCAGHHRQPSLRVVGTSGATRRTRPGILAARRGGTRRDQERRRCAADHRCTADHQGRGDIARPPLGVSHPQAGLKIKTLTRTNTKINPTNLL